MRINVTVVSYEISLRVRTGHLRFGHKHPVRGESGQFMTQRSISSDVLQKENGALGRIRTPDPLIRSQVLYPAELPERGRRGFSWTVQGLQGPNR